MNIRIYGDSIMKGTVLEEGRYRTMMGACIADFEAAFGHRVVNRARFGSTVSRGLDLLRQDVARGIPAGYALVEFGGNDCDFRWEEVAARPEAEHQPLTPLPAFEADYRALLKCLVDAGVTPVVMTLPPIDAERYLHHIGRTADRGRVLRWLGDAQMIYRFHELYSAKVAALAREVGAWMMDVRAHFLADHSLCRLIGEDGIHLNELGYHRLADILCGLTARRLAETVG